MSSLNPASKALVRNYDHPVAVTGGAGFLGREVVRQLQAAGCRDIRIIDLVPFTGAEATGVRAFQVDLRDGELGEAMAGVKTVLHLAACQYHTPLARTTYELPFYEVNVGGTERVLDAAERAGAERLVFVSTNMVYGLPQARPLTEAHPCVPFGPYGGSKLQAEQLLERAHGRKLETAVVRPGLIVGPGRIGVIARIFDWVLKGSPIWLIGGGSNRYEMMASEDVASLVLTVGRAQGHGVYNCAAKSVVPMREWIEAVIDKAHSRSRVVGIPAGPLKLAFRMLEQVRLSPLRKDQYLIADIDYYMDAALAQRELGWTPVWGAKEAILATFRWYLTEQNNPRYAELIAELQPFAAAQAQVSNHGGTSAAQPPAVAEPRARDRN